MKRWLAVNFFSTDVDMYEEPAIGKKEFYIEISLITATLALFGILLNAF